MNITFSPTYPPSYVFSLCHHPSCIFHFPLSSDLHVYKMEWFLSPSGEISCPRLPFCMQDIRMKGELGPTHTVSSSLSVSPQLNKNKHCCRMFCGGFYYSLEAACREYWTCANGGWLLCLDLFDHLNRLLSLVPRGLCSLQRQSVRLQPTCPRCSYSGGPTSADNPTGKMRTNLTNLFSDCVGATDSTWFST